MYLYFILCFFILLISFYFYIYLLKIKIERLEKKIIDLFNSRNNGIPSLYEITKGSFVKHDEIFKNILQLRKHHFSERDYNSGLIQII